MKAFTTIITVLAVVFLIVIVANWNKIVPASWMVGTKRVSSNNDSYTTNQTVSKEPVVIQSNQLDCEKVSGLTGTIKLGEHEFYCSGTFKCSADGSITCDQPNYYYYNYPNYTFPFYRTGFIGHPRIMQYGGVVSGSNQTISVQANQLDCAKVSGLTGTLKFGNHEFYCSGTFECTPDGKITCRNPQYYYYPYYYYTFFPFFRSGRGGAGIGGPGGPGSGTGGGTGPGTGGGGGPH